PLANTLSVPASVYIISSLLFPLILSLQLVPIINLPLSLIPVPPVSPSAIHFDCLTSSNDLESMRSRLDFKNPARFFTIFLMVPFPIPVTLRKGNIGSTEDAEPPEPVSRPADPV